MNDMKEHLLILLWIGLAIVLLFIVSPGDVQIPYAEY